jgi:hypothetical protein
MTWTRFSARTGAELGRDQTEDALSDFEGVLLVETGQIGPPDLLGTVPIPPSIRNRVILPALLCMTLCSCSRIPANRAAISSSDSEDISRIHFLNSRHSEPPVPGYVLELPDLNEEELMLHLFL